MLHSKERSGIVSIVIDASLPGLVNLCRQHGIIVNKRAGRLRVSPHFYNNYEELDGLIDIMTDFKNQPTSA